MAEPGNEQNTDILKYFIGVMGVLTLLVALFSVWYYVQTLQAEKAFKTEKNELAQMKTQGALPQFREAVRLSVETKGTLADTQDLQQFLISEASTPRGPDRLEIRDFINNTKTPKDQEGQGYTEQRVTLYFEKKDKPISLQNLTSYLFNVQARLPNVKVEKLTIAANTNRSGWNGSVTFVKYQPTEVAVP